ncbi:Solute carrier family 35 member B1-like [Oopsacas minuta]|uniref:Solute carrier family 35 member B1-like n=1 Tax=Oopsacas minuta TaxID=111878 RepID=A0AAV7KIC1_9METZ|nr:Solute carrier family 35 member B1-like [Oopsacas minuta]
MNRLLLFSICFFGIFFSYLTFGLIQESIQTRDYRDNEKYAYILTLVLFQSLTSCICGYLICQYYKLWNNPSPLSYYVGCSCCYFSAMVASNYALKWVSYPTQVIGKSCKPIPILILTTILAKRSQPLKRWLAVGCIVLGVIMFNLFKPGKSINYSMSIGDVFILISLLFDGLTASFQEVIRAKYKTNPYLLMYELNKWAVIILFPFILFGEGFAVVQFTFKNPEVIPMVLAFCFTSAIGQNFIFVTISNFGPLTLSLITTLRKFFTVLGSIIVFGHMFTIYQKISVGVVFTGILMDSWIKSSNK